MSGTLWYVSSDAIGSDQELGRKLSESFWNSLGERITEPVTFAFINRGVLLTLDDSPVLEALKALEERGCRFLSCGTCLSYYEAKERLAVGEVGNMPLLQELLRDADKVVSL